MTKKILITGASGLIGSSLKRHLEETGHLCVVLSANKKQKNQEHQFYWNPQNGIIDEDCLEGVHSIIHLAGAGIAARRWSEAYKKEILDSRVKGAQLLLQLAIKKQQHIAHFITASGVGIYPSGTGQPLNEQYKNGTDFLSDVCVQWEGAAQQFESIGSKVSALRTSVVLAKSGGFLEPFNTSMKFGILPVLGHKKQQLSWIHLNDMVRMYAALVDETLAPGIYNASAPESCAQDLFLKTLAAAAGKKCFFPRISPFLVRLIFGEQSALLLSDQQVVPEKLLQQGFVFKYPTLEAALAQIYAPK